jgi:hypothetical protein
VDLRPAGADSTPFTARFRGIWASDVAYPGAARGPGGFLHGQHKVCPFIFRHERRTLFGEVLGSLRGSLAHKISKATPVLPLSRKNVL